MHKICHTVLDLYSSGKEYDTANVSMPISTILNGCGKAKIDVGVYFNGRNIENPNLCGTDYDSCEESYGTLLVYLDGEKIGEITNNDRHGNINTGGPPLRLKNLPYRKPSCENKVLKTVLKETLY